MGWTISHGTPNLGGAFDGYHARSYGQVGDWRDALLALSLTGRDAAVLEPLTRRRPGDPFDIRPRQAAEIAAVLLRNKHRLPVAQWELTETLAAAAQRAATAAEKWRWS